MSRESILKIREVEDEAQRIVADAKARAQAMTEAARRDGKALCARVETETASEYDAKLAELGERAGQMRERVDAESREELSTLEGEIRLRRRVAEKMIIRGFEQKCR